MCDDDSFNVATVPRHAVFGAQPGKGDGEDESTLGDRFFDLLPLQTNAIAKADLDHCMSLRDRCKPVSSNTEQQFEQIPAVTAAIKDASKVTAIDIVDASVENIHDNVPFELNRLAMFRPPSRTLSGRRSNTVPREENTQQSACTVELNYQENSSSNVYVHKETTNYNSKISSRGSKQPAKTLRCSAPRPLYPTQRWSRVQSVEMERKIGSLTYQATTKVRAASAEPRTQKPVMGLMRTNSSSTSKTTEIATRIQPRGPLRVRSASSNAPPIRNIATRAENAVKTNQITMAQRRNGANLTTITVQNAKKVVSKPQAIRKSSYAGPETRARARMKQSSQSLEMTKISSAVNTTPKQSMPMKSNAEDGHVSRPRTRGTHEPVRVRNTQGRAKGADGLPPIESESRFRQSLTRRPKGSDSLDRDVTKATGKENRDEIWTLTAKKPEPLLEFAPCLRSRVAAKKVQSTSATHSTRSPKTGQSKQGVHPAPRRRTEAEREAFFRRLSTPKTVATVKKCTK
uniref:TPX2_importin domain-containing protein n=1 Tax=Loa loa TaxID=7209 RepID=A0A1I7VBH1_LOALO